MKTPHSPIFRIPLLLLAAVSTLIFFPLALGLPLPLANPAAMAASKDVFPHLGVAYDPYEIGIMEHTPQERDIAERDVAETAAAAVEAGVKFPPSGVAPVCRLFCLKPDFRSEPEPEPEPAGFTLRRVTRRDLLAPLAYESSIRMAEVPLPSILPVLPTPIYPPLSPIQQPVTSPPQQQSSEVLTTDLT